MAPRIRTPSSWHHHLPYPSSSGIPPTTLSNPLSYPITYARALAAVGHRRHPILLYPGLFQAPPPSLHTGTGDLSPPHPPSPTLGARPLSNLCRSHTGTYPLFPGQRADYPTPYTPSPSPTSNRLGGHGNTGLRLSRTPPFGLYLPSPLWTWAESPGYHSLGTSRPSSILPTCRWSRARHLDSIGSEK